MKSLSRLLIMVALALLCRATAQTAHPAQPSAPVANPQQLFHEGEAALKKNNLDAAERSFRGVLALDPQAASAYANLGVISMRRKQWPQALEMLHKAEHLMPQVPGIRLNVGLVYYRQNQIPCRHYAFRIGGARCP